MSELTKVTADDITKAMSTVMGLANEANDSGDREALYRFDKMWNSLLAARSPREEAEKSVGKPAHSKAVIDAFRKAGIKLEEETA